MYVYMYIRMSKTFHLHSGPEKSAPVVLPAEREYIYIYILELRVYIYIYIVVSTIIIIIIISSSSPREFTKGGLVKGGLAIYVLLVSDCC